MVIIRFLGITNMLEESLSGSHVSCNNAVFRIGRRLCCMRHTMKSLYRGHFPMIDAFWVVPLRHGWRVPAYLCAVNDVRGEKAVNLRRRIIGSSTISLLFLS